MNDDFNTAQALAVLFDLANEVNRSRSAALARQLQQLAGVLGLLQRNADDFLKGRKPMSPATEHAAPAEVSAQEEKILATIAARTEAKRQRDFAAADRIRAELLESGIVLEDKPGGITEWRRA